MRQISEGWRGVIVALAMLLAGITIAALLGGYNLATEIADRKITVRIVQSISPADVKTIFIELDGIGDIYLTSPKDDDIRRILSSLKRVTVADRECRLMDTDMLTVQLKKTGGVNIYGRFDPDRAPIISKSMRSDDLAGILYDVFKRRGIEPKRR